VYAAPVGTVYVQFLILRNYCNGHSANRTSPKNL
jgi:hypothetical protein